ncbi:nuclear transport factor 2 family protein [Sphingomonas psychrotolerans]|uniref:Nuclear transport factor 2 family protein n=1 Tax=Sphingomonas psychrotolerans TaxID=1327635 RepID=A0ABU3N1U2_9SPHN|nr:nuclear transport factor 2 family protein [Sphingomonas psychrotolerans]MDT8758524.1 nuclear transport factor 2 family protein [Sphingomonas psychrotolerans]
MRTAGTPAAAAVLLLLSTPASARAVQTNTQAAENLLQIADAFDRAQLTKDAAALERMIGDELIFIESSGRRLDKAAFIAGWTAPGDRFDPIRLVDRHLVPLGPDAFMVTAQTVLTGTSGGKRFTSAIRFTDTFRRTRGRWQAVHIQVTRLAAAD